MPESFSTLLALVWEQITACIGTITNNALLMIPIVISFVGSIIALATGFLGTRRRRRR